MAIEPNDQEVARPTIEGWARIEVFANHARVHWFLPLTDARGHRLHGRIGANRPAG